MRFWASDAFPLKKTLPIEEDTFDLQAESCAEKA